MKTGAGQITDAGLWEKLSRLSFEMVKSYSIKRLVEFAGEILGNPLAYFENSVKPVYISDEKLMDKYSNDAMQQASQMDFLTAEFVNKFPYHEMTERILNSDGPFLWEREGENRKIICKIDRGNESVAHLTLVEGEKRFTDDDYTIIAYTAEIIKNYWNKENRFFLGDRNREFISNLIQKQPEDDNDLRQHAKTLGWICSGNYCVLRIPMAEKHQKISLVRPENILRVFEPYTVSVRKNLHPIFYENALVAIVEIDDTLDRYAMDHNIRMFLSYTGLKASVSVVFSSLALTGHYYRQTIDLMFLGQQFMPDEQIYFSHALEQQQILYTLEKNHLIYDFCSPEVRKLFDSDKTNLQTTLRVFMQMQGNSMKTAEKLCIHRNTLSKRLVKISEITGLDLYDMNQFSKVKYTLDVMDYMEVRAHS